jgi:hypothetical protein
MARAQGKFRQDEGHEEAQREQGKPFPRRTRGMTVPGGFRTHAIKLMERNIFPRIIPACGAPVARLPEEWS